MPSRFYCVQSRAARAGWVDLPSLASVHEHEAIQSSQAFSEQNGVLTRVIRKPHGWSPPPQPAPVSEVVVPISPFEASRQLRQAGLVCNLSMVSSIDRFGVHILGGTHTIIERDITLFQDAFTILQERQDGPFEVNFAGSAERTPREVQVATLSFAVDVVLEEYTPQRPPWVDGVELQAANTPSLTDDQVRRREEKKRRRAEAEYNRRPTSWDQLDSPEFGVNPKGD